MGEKKQALKLNVANKWKMTTNLPNHIYFRSEIYQNVIDYNKYLLCKLKKV